jgi:hypothetical protein
LLDFLDFLDSLDSLDYLVGKGMDKFWLNQQKVVSL